MSTTTRQQTTTTHDKKTCATHEHYFDPHAWPVHIELGHIQDAFRLLVLQRHFARIVLCSLRKGAV